MDQATKRPAWNPHTLQGSHSTLGAGQMVLSHYLLRRKEHGKMLVTCYGRDSKQQSNQPNRGRTTIRFPSRLDTCGRTRQRHQDWTKQTKKRSGQRIRGRSQNETPHGTVFVLRPRQSIQHFPMGMPVSTNPVACRHSCRST